MGQVRWLPVFGCCFIGLGISGFLACILPSWAFFLVVALVGWALLRAEGYEKWLASKEE